jgi:hypothetical protein
MATGALWHTRPIYITSTCSFSACEGVGATEVKNVNGVRGTGRIRCVQMEIGE